MKRPILSGCVSLLALMGVARAAEMPAIDDYGSWGFNAGGMDRAIVPGNNFFDYANGAYLRDLVIPPDRTHYGSFDMLAVLSETRLHGMLEADARNVPQTPSDTRQKTGAFYASFLDEAAVQSKGAAPLAPDLGLVRAATTPSRIAALMGQSTTTFLGSIIDVSISPDAKDPTQYAVQLAQSGLGLPDRDYYLTAEFKPKLALYHDYVAKVLGLAGWQDSAAAASRLIAFETRIAQASWSRAEDRDADKTYNPMTLTELKAAAPGFDWEAYFTGAGLKPPARVVLGEKTAILAIAQLAHDTDAQTLRDWSAFHLANNAAASLSHDFADAKFEFYGHQLQGQPQQKLRWKRAVAAADGAMGDAIGQEYVEKYFPPDSRVQMAKLTQDLRGAFRTRLAHNSWMSDETKQKAVAKLDAFDFQIGYPKKWRDYATLVVKSDDLYGNLERATAHEWTYWVGHLGHPVDHDEWEMFPQTVNAYNEPVFNEVVFPAAILQPPFFNPKADPAINYGAIGGVIGHEMTHSIDDQGRKYDLHGKLDDWWTKQDAARFDERAKRYGAQFAAMTLPYGGHINPDLTMGENIADLGGLTLALEAYHTSLAGKPAPVIDGMTGDQRVFLGWAQVWREKVRPDAARQLLVVDPHSPPLARVNGPMHNIADWYSAFGVKQGDALYLAPGDRVVIW